MKKWRIIFKCKDGFIGEEFVYAVNRMMAWDLFEELGYDTNELIIISCLLVEDEKGNAYYDNYEKTF